MENEKESMASQVYQLIMKVRSGCLEDDVELISKANNSTSKTGAQHLKKAKVAKKNEESKELFPDGNKNLFNKLDQKTVDLSESIIQQINSTLTFLTCENSTLQQQILKMQIEIEQENKIKKEFTSEFD